MEDQVGKDLVEPLEVVSMDPTDDRRQLLVESHTDRRGPRVEGFGELLIREISRAALSDGEGGQGVQAALALRIVDGAGLK